MLAKSIQIVFFLCLVNMSYAQNGCSTLGQTPLTAFPVCGTDTFSQTTVPLCGGKTIPVPPCANSQNNTYNDINPFWYKFTCFKAGTLGLTITPLSLSDDYDWQIFDVTNRNPDDVYTDPSLFVSCNWSGITGVTGTSPTASSLNECGSFNTTNPPNKSLLPTLIQGHNYILLISNFSSSQKGYKLSFGGGTAVITDPTPPDMKKAYSVCGANAVYLKLNKLMKCNTIAANGSDFSISNNVSISSVTGVGCNSNFDTDSLIISLTNPIPAGNYVLTAKNGSDGNTVLDYCDNGIPVGNIQNFIVSSSQLIRSAFNFQISYSCKVDTVHFNFSGISNGSTLEWIFDNGQTISLNNFYIVYSSFGKKEVTLIVKNSVCSDTSYAVVDLQNDPLKASFEVTTFLCPNDTAFITNSSTGNIVNYNWDFSNGFTSNVKNPSPQFYPLLNVQRNYPIKLVVNNALNCFDTTYRLISVVPNCYIAVPSGFTPNGDGLNDYLYPLNAYKAINLLFRIYNRFGQLIFETKDWTRKWDGTYKSTKQPSGAYVWTLQYTEPTTQKTISEKGTTVLIR
jgi:gliding motility-associated-like protein